MVQILPPKTNLGTFIGEKVSQGLDKGIQQGIQRSQLQNALGEIEALGNNPNTSPFELATTLMKATAGIPGAERYVAPLFEQLVKTQQTNRIFGERKGDNIPSRGEINQKKLPEFQTSKNESVGVTDESGLSQLGVPPTISKEGFPQPQKTTNSGILPQIMTPSEINQMAEQNARIENDPSRKAFWLDTLNNQNKIALNQRQFLEKYVNDQGISPKDVPEFMQLGQRYANVTNIDDWVKATKRDFDNYKNVTTQLDNTFTPGFFRGLVSGPKHREKRLNELNTPVKQLIDLGKESEVRGKLAAEGLSPIEIEERIHPLSERIKKNFEKLPNGPFKEEKDFLENEYFKLLDPKQLLNSEPRSLKTYDELLQSSPKTIDKMNDRISKWIKDNLSDEDSLLVLRQKLWEDKHYDWRQFGAALDKAIGNGLKISSSQQSELKDVYNNPPTQSLSDIFTDWTRWIDYLKGVK